MKRLRSFLPIPLLAAAALLAFSFMQPSFFEISKNLEILASLYHELDENYVDEINVAELNRAGIAWMLNSLDPYTSFIDEEDVEEYNIQTTGKYGGIGALIGTRDDYVMITEPYENMPAAKYGLLAGDRILAVDGKAAKGFRTDEVSKMLKGIPGTAVKVRIARLSADSTDKTLELQLIREEIQIKNIPYYGLLEPGIGYIRLSDFRDRAGVEVKNAINAMSYKEPLKGLVLDLRGNPGGLLNEAINVSNVFLEKGKEIVSTRGRVEEWNKSFESLNEPTDTKVPLVVLVNGGSASASEIVAGSLQDYDRAVIMGQKTFGKGLVQTTRPAPFNTRIKVTTAKYYIPSGRCIQSVDYSEHEEHARPKKIADSLKVAFKTKNGRTVYDGGGIDPDLSLEPERLRPLAITLLGNNLLFDYATWYRARNNSIGPARNFRADDRIYSDFTAFLNARKYSYKTESEEYVSRLKQKAADEGMNAEVDSAFARLNRSLSGDKKKDLIKDREQISSLLEEEIASRYSLATGRIEASFRSDQELAAAISLLKEPQRYRNILKVNSTN